MTRVKVSSGTWQALDSMPPKQTQPQDSPVQSQNRKALLRYLNAADRQPKMPEHPSPRAAIPIIHYCNVRINSGTFSSTACVQTWESFGDSKLLKDQLVRLVEFLHGGTFVVLCREQNVEEKMEDADSRISGFAVTHM